MCGTIKSNMHKQELSQIERKIEWDADRNDNQKDDLRNCYKMPKSGHLGSYNRSKWAEI